MGVDVDVVAILDAGAQYCKVIDRRVRELNCCSEILPLGTPASVLADPRYKGVIISGGPNSLAENPELAQKLDREILTLGRPVLGICYGLQLLNVLGGGTVERKAIREDGQFDVDLDRHGASHLWDGIADRTTVLLTHGDSIGVLSNSYVAIARSSDPPHVISGIAHKSLPVFGVQFHPEVSLSVDGVKMLENFLVKVCRLTQTYTPISRQLSAIHYIRDAVGETDSVLVLASGGVDSTVVCALLSKAIAPDRIYALHVNTGFMREGESESVARALSVLGLRLHTVNARDEFLSATTVINGKRTPALRDTVDPETKRTIIGDCFMAVCDKEIHRLGLDRKACVLAQGSLRPDLIESGSPSVGSSAQVIKTHHNDTQLVRQLRETGRIVEPLRDYHKDEVRALGAELGLPDSIVWRQPFPGPGLAIRLLCAREPFLPDDVDRVKERLSLFSKSEMPNGCTACLMPVRTVGVQGDGRSYASLVGILVSGTVEWNSLVEHARRIPKQVHKANRVVVVLPSGLDTDIPLTVTQTLLGDDEVALLRAADKIVNDILAAKNLLKVLSQVPVVFLPANFGVAGKRTIALRPFITDDFMTGVPAVPGVHFPIEVVDEIVNKILRDIPQIVRVCYDITAKPPATTEWE
ncbi:unnamed protein product (mitochondrion) [Plasmodiophora brassicae]|uniref:GMP synthase (glutamine-hydrolyzing) n=1 Tax=Plasmodiophora brassicae TaxID=37360 RepID=A0A0G4J3A3_PLABS|nr:hypothetical protein PBRA_002277 [Plasmodiophora brassicae]SPQ98866.1 unnamed protein product [Plasmodiophora brassicae]